MTNTKKKILLIDDDPSVSAALLMLLKDEFETHAASNALDGVRMFDRLQPNLVILDLHLPDRHGLDALRSIRGLDRSAPVVILTGYASLEVVEESMRLGASDCLHKPLDANLLRNRLRELMDEASSMEIALREAERAREKAAANEGLVSSAFLHDVGNPLTSLNALTLLLKEKENDSETRLKLVRMIEQNVAYLGSLVDQWRAFSEPQTLSKDYASLAEIVEEVLGFVSLRAEAKGVALVAAGEPSDCGPDLNRHAVARILVNIVQNAIESAPRTGGRVDFQARRRGDWAEFIVTDNGPGIDPEHTQRIFDARYTTKRKGTGLGLYIARSIVEAAHGSIELCSRPGRGATFTIRLSIKDLT